MMTAMRGIYKRGNVFWVAYKTDHGVVRESAGTPDRRLAEAVLAKRKAEVFEGRWVGRVLERKVRLREAIAEFIAVYSKPRKVSWMEDERILNRLAAFVGENTFIHMIDRKTIERFHEKLLAAGLTKSRVNRYTQSMKCFFNRCIDWQKLKANPCKGIRLHPESNRTHWLEEGQIARLLAAASERLRPILQVALLTGLRLGDILRLHWSQIDWEDNVIRVTQSKTGTPLVLPVSEALQGVLRGIPRSPGAETVFAFACSPVSRFGWFRTDFQKAIKTAALPGTRMHDLRHTAATQLRRLGCDLPVIQQLLGHRSVRTTLRYAHVHPTELREAMGKLGAKVMPSRVSHFTITSQSGFSEDVARSVQIENESKSRHETKIGFAVPEAIHRAVNTEEAPSEDW